MTKPHIALLRKSGKYMLALVRTGADNRLWATGADGRPFRISPQQLVWETDVAVEDAGLAAWLAEAERLAGGTDLEEAWKVVQGEVPGLSLRDLAELVWSPPIESHQLGALLLSLFTPALRYFRGETPDLVPLPPEEVAEQARRLEHHQQVAEEEAAFVAWLAGTSESRPSTPRQLGWLETTRQYVVEGDASTAARPVKEWLRQVRQTPDPQRLAFELLVERGEMDEDEFLTLRRMGFPTAFSQETLAEAERLGGLGMTEVSGRRDLSKMDVFTIDEASTIDIDDALSVRRTEAGYEVGVHIADAAALVPREGPVEDAARERLTSLYLPEGTLPMLPRQLSEVAGSLAPGELKPAVTLLARMDERLDLQDWEIFRSVVRSRRRLSYEEGDAALLDAHAPYGEQLQMLRSLSRPLHEARITAGALEMDRPEVKVSVDQARIIEVSVTPVPTPARRLVAEFMVLANRLVGSFLRDRGVPAIYRTQEPVNLEEVPETSVDAVRQYHILRRIRPARLATTPGAHALIGVEPYVQVTSPLRRYLDLVVQRQLASVLDGGAPAYSLQEIKEALYQADATVRDLNRVEEERKRYWVLKHLGTRVGEEFPAVVLDVRDHHSVVELDTYLIRSNVYLKPETQPGQRVRLTLQEVDTWKQQAHFLHVE